MFLEPSFDETSSHLECYALVQSISAGDFAARTKFDHMVMETLEGGWFFGGLFGIFLAFFLSPRSEGLH